MMRLPQDTGFVEIPLTSVAPVDDHAMSAAAFGRSILVVCAHADIEGILVSTLQSAGYSVDSGSIATARHRLQQMRPNVLILDWDMPGVIAVDLIRQAHKDREARTLVVAISAYSGEDHVVASFEQGVDDYIVRPFSQAEFAARIRALIRRLPSSREAGDLVVFQQMVLDPMQNLVTIDGAAVVLRTMEFRLLEFFMRHPERAFSRETLLQRVWQHDDPIDVRAVDVTVQRLRKALALQSCDAYIQTVRGLGYRLGR